MGTIAKLWKDVSRVANHVAVDLKYGGFLGGTRASRYGALGCYEIANSSYDALKVMLGGRLKPGDSVVDVGCGKGRVINYFLSLDFKLNIVGIEMDEDVARATSVRLQDYPTVRIFTGDARAHLPDSVDLLYMYNPFDLTVMTQFEPLLRSRVSQIVYYNPLHLSVFSRAPWVIQTYPLQQTGLHHDFAVITPSARTRA